jgi:hypothetical protein
MSENSETVRGRRRRRRRRRGGRRFVVPRPGVTLSHLVKNEPGQYFSLEMCVSAAPKDA